MQRPRLYSLQCALVVSPYILLHGQNQTEDIKQVTVWLSSLITSVMLLGLPCAYPFTAFETHGTKKLSLIPGYSEVDRGLSISVSVEEHPPSAAPWEFSITEPGTVWKACKVLD